jgi:hypothetical protein
MSYLTSDLITAIKRRAAVPTSQVTFTNTDFLALTDEEIRSKMVPLILKTQEEYFIRLYDYAVTANQAGYLIPTRAIANKLRNVQIVDSNNDLNRADLERLSPEDLFSGYSGSAYVTIQKSGFYLEGNKVVLFPTPNQTQSLLRLSYYCRPNVLVETTDCAKVTAIDTTNKQITVDALPSTISTSTPLDFVKANPGFECSAIDQTPTNIAGMVLTFASALPSDLAVGDYVCLAGQSCVVQIPVELQPLLTQYVVVRVLSAQGDSQALADAGKELQKLEENALLLISPRVDGKAKRVTNGRSLSRWV